MALLYDGNRIIPAPLVEINKEYNISTDGTKLSPIFNITLNGTIVAYKGSPDSNGVFFNSSLTLYPDDENIDSDIRLRVVMSKQEMLRKLFSNEGKLLEIYAPDGNTPIKFNPRKISIQFPNGIWFDRSDYTITMETDKIYSIVAGDEEDDALHNLGYHISDASEEWNIDLDETPATKPVYKLSHQLKAVGKRFYNEDGTLERHPWQQARLWVQANLGFSDMVITSGLLCIPSNYKPYNHIRSEVIDILGGSYSLNENWIVASGITFAIEDYTVTVNSGIEDPLVKVSIDGNIQGLDQKDDCLILLTGESKYESAIRYYDTNVSPNILGRIQSLGAPSDLNVKPISTVIKRNQIVGTISYTFDFDNRPSNLVSSALSEVIDINDQLASQVFAIVPILGRANGPILQDISTVKESRREFTYQGVFPAVGGSLTSRLVGKPNVNSLVDEARHASNIESIFIESDSETWAPNRGSYTRRVSWIYTENP